MGGWVRTAGHSEGADSPAEPRRLFPLERVRKGGLAADIFWIRPAIAPCGEQGSQLLRQVEFQIGALPQHVIEPERAGELAPTVLLKQGSLPPKLEIKIRGPPVGPVMQEV